MGDLVTGHYPQNHALQAFLGTPGQAAQGNLPVRSNLEFPIFSGALVDTAAALVSGVMTVVPVPVDIGMEITNISVVIGATAGSTVSHQWAALYSGTTVAAPPLIGQTADGLAGAMAASGRFDFSFASGSQQIVTPAQAPYGYLWAAIAVTATTAVPSLITTPSGAAAASGFRWFTNAPKYFSLSSGSAVGATAPATLIEASQPTVAPVVFVW